MENLAKSWLTALFEHPEGRGMVWFGLLFWGSVFNAVASQFSSGWQLFRGGAVRVRDGLRLGGNCQAPGPLAVSNGLRIHAERMRFNLLMT